MNVTWNLYIFSKIRGIIRKIRIVAYNPQLQRALRSPAFCLKYLSTLKYQAMGCTTEESELDSLQRQLATCQEGLSSVELLPLWACRDRLCLISGSTSDDTVNKRRFLDIWQPASCPFRTSPLTNQSITGELLGNRTSERVRPGETYYSFSCNRVFTWFRIIRYRTQSIVWMSRSGG
jgi:hypothetical protein